MRQAISISPVTAEGDRVVPVLAVGLGDDDHSSLKWVFAHSNWRLHRTRDSNSTMRFLNDHRIGVVLAPADLQDGTWHNLLDRMRRLPAPPLLIVVTEDTDTEFWAEALNRGAYDVLCKPFDRAEVISVVSLTWLHWKDGIKGGPQPVRIQLHPGYWNSDATL
jgi:FixJ family two-component response regulator